ncbi:MAG: universal stress protein [Candidatus Rokuibacteriota bacterium]
MKRFQRILHPSDFSPASRPALAQAIDLARHDGARLTIMHVITPPVPIVGEGYVSPTLWADLDRQMRDHAGKQMRALLTRARQAGVRATGVLLEGPPADRIVRAARRLKADVIVMGTHGRSGLARIFVGSVAGRVIATARCPVLTVRGRAA